MHQRSSAPGPRSPVLTREVCITGPLGRDSSILGFEFPVESKKMAIQSIWSTPSQPRPLREDISNPTRLDRSASRYPWRTAAVLSLAGFAVLTLAAGCSSMASMEPLEVSLSNLEITDVTVFETTMVAQLRITNPNPEPLTINGGSFKLMLDDTKVGTGTASETFTVERLDSAVVDATFHLNNAAALLRLQGILQKKEVAYGVRGWLFTEGTFGTKKIKIDKTGRLDLSDMNPTGIERHDAEGLQPTG